MCIGDKIKQLRNDNTLTQKQFADKIFVTRSAVAKWEQNRGVPCADTLEIICKEFNVTSSYFMDKNINEFQIIEKVATAKTMSKKNKILTIGGIILSSLLVGTTVLCVCLGVNKGNSKTPENKEPNFWIGHSINFRGGEVKHLDVEKQRVYYTDGEFITIDDNTPLYDIEGHKLPFDALIKYMNNEGLFNYDGNLVVLFDYNNNKVESATIYNTLSPIENMYGCFFKTWKADEVTEAPFYAPIIGLNNEKWNDSYLLPITPEDYKVRYSYSHQYPYFYVYENDGSGRFSASSAYGMRSGRNYDWTSIFSGNRGRSTSFFEDSFISMINVSNDLNSIDLYSIDASENHTKLLNTFKKDSNEPFNIAATQYYLNDLRKCVTTFDMNITVNFVDTVENLKIEQLNKNMEVLKTLEFEFYEEKFLFGNKLEFGDSNVKYLRITTIDNGEEKQQLISSTSSLEVNVKTYFGYSEKITIEFDASKYMG